MKYEPTTDRFLETIRKTHSNWQKDKELTQIVKKMEKRKNLKKKEFSKVLLVTMGNRAL